MFNLHETGDEKERERVTQERLESLKRAREAGYFDEEPTEKMPEVMADGYGPDDGWLKEPPPDSTNAAEVYKGQGFGGTPVLPRDAPDPHPASPSSQWCGTCEKKTRHVTYGIGTPTWHCAICCICDWCMAQLGGQVVTDLSGEPRLKTRTSEQVEKGREALLKAVTDDSLSFCTKCGAGLRCGVCHGEGTGDYCELCGKKVGEEGFCTDCWKEND